MHRPEARVEASFLIPLTEDPEVGSGELHRSERWDALRRGLLRLAGGWSREALPVAGEWLDPATGRLVADESYRFVVAIEESELPRLRRFLAAASVAFRQKTIYLSIAGSVEFIENPRRKPP